MFWKSTLWQKTPLPVVPNCGSCGLYKDCRSPKMKVNGEGRKEILILGEAPGPVEDRRNAVLVGPSGSMLADMLADCGVVMRRDCWLTNALICFPHTVDGSIRTPTATEVNHCRANLVRTLQTLKPRVIIPLGRLAMKSLLPMAWGKSESEAHAETDEITRWVGWKIPSTLLNAWICPTYHPAHLLRNDRDYALHMHTRRHLETATSFQGRPWKEVPDYTRKVRAILDPDQAVCEIHRYISMGVPLAVDYETSTLKPHGPHARILCCSVSDGDTAIAYPWLPRTREATGELLFSDIPKVVAQLKFEEGWTRKEFGRGVKNWFWDTVLGGHWLDCRGGVCSVKFLAFVLLGMPDYDSHLAAYKTSSGSNNTNRLHEVEPRTLLTYCALDALLEMRIARKQAELGGLPWPPQQ